MNILPDPRRRRFLGTISAALAAFGFGRYAMAVTGGAGRSAEDALAWRAVALFTDRRSARIVGREYLRQRPREADLSRLVALIYSGASLPPPRPAADGDAGHVRDWLSSRIREDFARGRVVRVNGWLLAATEGRLCALAGLLRGPKRRGG